ncbi:hypothetical protein BH09BAC3_BH09BAC3_31800 [soil metagenome]
MGFFSSSKSSPEPSNKVWKTDSEFLKGITREALLSIRNSETTAIITVFEEAQKRIITFLNSAGITFNNLDPFSGKDALDNATIIHVIDASSGIISRSLTLNKKVNFLFFGHYPYAPVEKTIIEQLGTQFTSGKISFCSSLDAPFFEAFGGANLKPTMEALGMREDEFIEHKMVNKAILNAMEKIDKKVITERKAKSEREWFEKNVE